MILLPLKDTHELYAVLDAINIFASAAEDTGDRALADSCDAIGDRIRELTQLAVVDAQQWLGAAGIGRARGRPQG